MNYLKGIAPIFTLTLATLCVGSLDAAVLVSWGPSADIVTGNQSMTVGNNSTAVGFGSGYSSPAISASYYSSNTGKTPEFYGASFALVQDPTLNDGAVTQSGSLYRINSNVSPANDTILLNAPNALVTATLHETHSAFIWTDTEFLNGGNQTLTGMDMLQGDNGSTSASNSYFIIRLDATWYVSETFGEGGGTFTDPSTVAWFDYDPTVNFTTIGAAAAISDFSNLTAVGFYTNTKAAGSDKRFVTSTVTSFEVTATSVPEPATTVLLLAGVVGVLVAIKRRRCA